MQTRRGFLSASASAVAFAGVPAVVRAQQPPLTEVVWGVLGTSATEWPEYIAAAKGFFVEQGIKLTTIAAGSPPAVIQQLSTGALNLATDGSDSVMAAIGRGLPIKAIAPGFVPNPYQLVVTPAIKTWADLKGKAIMLGTKQDVTALALQKLAEQQKMTLDDFSIIVGGNSGARFAALMSGNVGGAMLAQPFDFEAVDKGMHVLGSAWDVLKDWQFTTITANVAWADKNRDLVVRFLRAYRKSVIFGYAKRDESIAALTSETKFDPSIATRSYDLVWAKLKAFDPNLRISPAALDAVAKSQLDFGAISALPKIADVYDPSYAAEAVKG
jgi:ABC-type nitrate/sulfonate/bicarbonate transport system substrate-binding protein